MYSLEIYGKWKIQASKQASNMQPTYTQCCHASLGLPQACMPQLMLALSNSYSLSWGWSFYPNTIYAIKRVILH